MYYRWATEYELVSHMSLQRFYIGDLHNNQLAFCCLSNNPRFCRYPISSVLYDNILGCALMGVLAINKAWFVCNFYAVYIGLGVGFCGSLTSFSSWQVRGHASCRDDMVIETLVCI